MTGMQLPPSLVNLNVRFNAMSLRERALVGLALLAVLVLAWDRVLMHPLELRKQQLTAELSDTQKALATLSSSIEGRATNDPYLQAMQQQQNLQASLAAVDAQLQSASAGLIEPAHMLGAMRDMLDRQQGLRLVSLRNLPVSTLAPPTESTPGKSPVPVMSGPYVHPVEMVIEGSYLDILRYLQSVESLQWRFYWQLLELESKEYPRNRVRLRLNTLSMDKEWLGV